MHIRFCGGFSANTNDYRLGSETVKWLKAGDIHLMSSTVLLWKAFLMAEFKSHTCNPVQREKKRTEKKKREKKKIEKRRKKKKGCKWEFSQLELALSGQIYIFVIIQICLGEKLNYQLFLQIQGGILSICYLLPQS